MLKSKLFFCLFVLLATNLLKNNMIFAQNKNEVDSLITLAESYFYDNNFDSAKIFYKNVLDLDGKNTKALLGLAKNEYQQTDLLDVLSNKNYAFAKNQERIKTGKSITKFNNALGYVQEALRIDPDNIEANYLAGILYREKMRLRFAVSRGNSFENGLKYFQKALSLNNGYKDIYVQYALLFRFYDKYTEALDTCMKAIETNPSYSPAYFAYKRNALEFFMEGDKKEIDKYLDVENDIFRKYLAGEYARFKGKSEQAIGIFKKLLINYEVTPQHYTNYSNFPITLVYSSLLKIFAKEGLPEKVNETFWVAVNNIRTDVEADAIFDDLKYLASDEELSRYFKLGLEEKKQKFFNSFWNKRHPETNMNYSQRLFEHYQRLVKAEKEYFAKRERVLFKNPWNSYEFNYEFTDQGLIFIKHGSPDKINITSTYSAEQTNQQYQMTSGLDKVYHEEITGIELKTVGGMEVADTSIARSLNSRNRPIRNTDDSLIFAGPINEQWLYNESPYNKKMIFCFIGSEKKLTSNFFDKEILKDIKHWDSDFFRYVNSSNPTDEDEATQKMVKTGQEKLALGVTSERSSIRTATKEITMPNEIYKMKGEKGKTHLKIAYYLPYRTLLDEIASDIDTLYVESGYMILDKDWNISAVKLDTLPLLRSKKKTYSQIKFLFIDVDPDSSEINLFFNPLNSNISCFYKTRTKIENYSKLGLKLSDIVIASKLEKSDKKGFFTRNGMDIVPSATSKYPLDKLLNIYYEVYGLKKNSEGKTLYNVEYSFRYSGKDENLLKKIFNSNDGQTISTEYSKSGKESTSNEYISFDLNKLKEGTYDFEVIIKDINSQTTVKKNKRIELFD